MEYRAIGTKYATINRYDTMKHASYDYKNKGLLTQVLPKVITSTTNPTTKIVLDFVEQSMLFLLSYVDELKEFKNPNFKRY